METRDLDAPVPHHRLQVRLELLAACPVDQQADLDALLGLRRQDLRYPPADVTGPPHVGLDVDGLLRALQIRQKPVEELSVLPDLDPVAFDQRTARERHDRRQLLFEGRAVLRLELEGLVVENRPQQQHQEADEGEQAVDDRDVNADVAAIVVRRVRRPRAPPLQPARSAGGARWSVVVTGQ